jgi:O-antigen/teichoic acid export membrane protein
MCWFIRLALPAYEYSLGIFRIVLPGLILSSSITVVMHNYFKTLEQNMKFFVLSLTVLILSLVSGLGAYYIFHTMEAVSWASVIIMIVWYVLSERFLKKQYGISSGVNLIYLILVSAVFYLISLIDIWYIGMVAYMCAAVVITGLFYFKDIKALVKR